MNQAQRNFLIQKIRDGVNAQVKLIEGNKEEPPSLSNYLLHAVMAGTFEIITNDQIKELIRKKALNSKANSDSWMSRDSGWGSSDKKLAFDPKDFFILPEEYKKLWDEHRIRQEQIHQEVNDLKIKTDGLITRIQLASDKTLQAMINEIDDMGNITLMDTTLKSLTSPSFNKALNG